MVTILGENTMDLASFSVKKIQDLVNNNVDTLFFTGTHGKDQKAFIVVDGQTAQITNWVLDRVLMSAESDPCGLTTERSLLG
tara:strand:+ start:804 stop:1049 length:246 start_codon:yes stop_codon:yes gene_type:complete